MNLILCKLKYVLGSSRIGLYFWGFGEKLNWFYGFLEQKKNTFRKFSSFLSGIWGDHFIIFRDQGSTDPLLGASLLCVYILFHLLNAISKQDKMQGFFSQLDNARFFFNNRPFHIVISLSNRSSIEKSITTFENEGTDGLLVTMQNHTMMHLKSIVLAFHCKNEIS